MRVVLVDAGGANLGSVRYALRRLGVEAEVSRDAAAIRAADRVILPGVSTAATVMRRLAELGLVEVLRSLQAPLLGVCVGMQLLFEHSEEDDTPCLGLLPGRVARLRQAPGLRIPHMGWNRLQPLRRDPLTEGIAPGAWAYFVHSYAAAPGQDCLLASEHGVSFAAVVRRGAVAGAQFHPERSGPAGARLLANFLGAGMA
ncbi:imidazole glycerol phosphate synthase subunit HisH [Luteimonas sp. RD2P54]|uniref:Imidazole glycerol phosphate synthase subunit HisH n=1 Tax=Luteimonas endophytica TaxID=3042023 RepID=A0ABT6J3Z3_9GAMM|nr:imidazole glycerol phosphate synthase subunit HisH [Luteimonas endophytica]MDH5821537.1 imidazole glycerol phosphate synthase subunit HisH [Luteimonas endophytica]